MTLTSEWGNILRNIWWGDCTLRLYYYYYFRPFWSSLDSCILFSPARYKYFLRFLCMNALCTHCSHPIVSLMNTLSHENGLHMDFAKQRAIHMVPLPLHMPIDNPPQQTGKKIPTNWQNK